MQLFNVQSFDVSDISILIDSIKAFDEMMSQIEKLIPLDKIEEFRDTIKGATI